MTWAEKLPGFNPEKVCRYTALKLYLCPLESPGAVRMAYWRDDGHLVRVRDLTPEEKAWIESNPLPYKTNQEAFGKWLRKIRNL